MNKIYKVIWSKARHQYVVASELAKSVTKGAGSCIGRTAAAVLAAIVLTAGAGLPAQAVDLQSDGNAQYHVALPTILGQDLSFDIDVPLTVTTSGENVAASLEGQSLNLGGLTVSGSNVLTEAAMDGVVKWDDENDNSIHGVKLESGKVTTAAGADLDEVYNRTDTITKIGATTLINNKLGVNEAGASIPGTDGNTAVKLGTNGVIEVSKDVKTLDGVSLVGLNKTVEALGTTVDENAKGAVKWDKDDDGNYLDGMNSTTATLKGVQFTGDDDLTVEGLTADTISAADGNFTVDENGNLKAAGGIVSGTVSQYAVGGIAVGEGSVTNGVYGVALGNGAQASGTNSTALGRSSSASGSDSVALGDYSVATEANEVSLGRGAIGSNGYIARRLTHMADGINDDDAATVGQMNTAVGEATEGVVKWDIDAEGNYVDGSLRGMHFLGKDGIVTFGNENKVLINGTTGQIVADSMGANSIATKNLSAGNGAVTVDENGKLSTTGEVLMQNGEGESLSMTDGGLNMMTTGDNGTGMLTVANGGISMMGGGNTTVKVDGSGTTFGTLMGDEKTVISGNSITTGSVTGLTNTEWTGKAEDIVENRAATEGQLAALSDDLNASIGTATEGVVKWDEDGNGGYKEGYLTAEHQLSAGNGNLLVDEEGVHLKTPGEILGDAEDETNYYLDMTNEHGISMGYTGGTSMTITTQGVTFSDAFDNSTVINGNNIDSGSNGILHTGTVYASENMYIGDSQNPDNEVATKGDLSDAVSTATDGMVKWDQDETTGEYTNSIHGVGLEDGKITAENGGNIGGVEFGGNGTINAADGNFTVDENGNTGIGGNLDVAGDLTIKDGQGGYINVGDSLTSIKDSIADVNSNISGVKSDVAQNKADISGIKGQIGAVGEDGSLGLTNGADTLVGGINQNASAIQANKDAIGDVSSLKGTDASGNKYTNLTDAVNGNYDAIRVTQTAVQQQGQAINALGGRVHELGEEIDSVGAISSALAGLHPLDYDGTGSKFQLSAAMGTYDGTQAAAIGGFYHFNEDVMLSLGGATAFNGEHKTAANIGVTFRVGPGGSEKKPATPDEVMATLDAMNRKIQEMDAKIVALEQDKKDLTEENQQLKAEAAEAVTAEAPAAEEQA